MLESACRYWTESARLLAIAAYKSRSTKLCGCTVTIMLNETRRLEADSMTASDRTSPFRGKGGNVWNRRNLAIGAPVGVRPESTTQTGHSWARLTRRRAGHDT